MNDSNDENAKTNLRVLEFDRKKERNEANEVVADMFQKLADRARQGEIEDFVITFRSSTKGTESMIGGTIRGFDFVGYIGMLEVLKQRLLDIMSNMTYAYSFEKPSKGKPEEEKGDGDSTEET